jgi:hypothetical protein
MTFAVQCGSKLLPALREQHHLPAFRRKKVIIIVHGPNLWLLQSILPMVLHHLQHRLVLIGQNLEAMMASTEKGSCEIFVEQIIYVSNVEINSPKSISASVLVSCLLSKWENLEKCCLTMPCKHWNCFRKLS